MTAEKNRGRVAADFAIVARRATTAELAEIGYYVCPVDTLHIAFNRELLRLERLGVS